MNLKINAYAKINLTLKVLGKREDGYHELETVMQTIALHDVLTLTECKDNIKLTVEGMAPVGEDNLVYRAAKLIQKQCGCQKGVQINLVKNIPMEAGLAGGSTDAAATLIGLNKLWKLELNLNELLRLGEKLGADVPFCLYRGTALAQGKGEILTPLKAVPKMGIVLIKPSFGVSTADVFQRFSKASLGKRPNTQAMINAVEEGNVTEIAHNLANDLEYVTLEMYPELNKIKMQLESLAVEGVLMSGSGPTIFALTKDEETASYIASRLDNSNAKVIVTSTENLQESTQ